MVLQKSVDKLKQKPKEDRTAVASGVAVAIGGLLFIIWLVIFFQRIRSGAVSPSLKASNQFSQQAMQAAQQALLQQQSSPNQDLIDLRNAIESQQQVQPVVPQSQSAPSFTGN